MVYGVGDILDIKIIQEEVTSLSIKIIEVCYDLHRKPSYYKISIIWSSNPKLYKINSETFFDLSDLEDTIIPTKFTYYPFKDNCTIKEERQGVIWHQFKSHTVEEILNNRASAYKFIDFSDN